MGYTIKQKIDICLMSESNPEMTQADLALWTHRKYGTSKPPSQTTISRILSSKTQLISSKKHEFALIRRRKPSNLVLRNVLQEWISQSIWDGIPVSIPIMQHAAHDFWYRLPSDLRQGTGEFNSKWCHQFLHKVNIKLNSLDHHALTTSQHKIWTFEERVALQGELSQYNVKDIFSIDEIQLCYNLPLDNVYYNEYPNFLQKKSAIPHVTVMFGINVDGSERLEPLIVGNYEYERSGGTGYTSAGQSSAGQSSAGQSSAKYFERNGITYKSNRKAWLTSTMFYDYLSILDKRLAMTNREIVILIDDCSAHKIINVNLMKIKLIVTNSGGDSNSTPAKSFLPFNWGIIEEFKILYRLQQYLHMINVQRNSEHHQLLPLTAQQYRIGLLDCVAWIKRAWDSIPQATVLACWTYSHVVPPNHLTDLVREHPALSRDPHRKSLEKLRVLIGQLRVNEVWDVQALLNLAKERKNKIYISNQEIIDVCIVDEAEPPVNNVDTFEHDMMSESPGSFSSVDEQSGGVMKLSSMSIHDLFSFQPALSSLGDAGLAISTTTDFFQEDSLKFGKESKKGVISERQAPAVSGSNEDSTQGKTVFKPTVSSLSFESSFHLCDKGFLPFDGHAADLPPYQYNSHDTTFNDRHFHQLGEMGTDSRVQMPSGLAYAIQDREKTLHIPDQGSHKHALSSSDLQGLAYCYRKHATDETPLSRVLQDDYAIPSTQHRSEDVSTRAKVSLLSQVLRLSDDGQLEFSSSTVHEIKTALMGSLNELKQEEMLHGMGYS